MSKYKATGSDKNIVDRSRKSRGGSSARAIKDVRYRLNSFQPTSPRFERELMLAFARNHLNAIILFPVIVLLVGVISYQWAGFIMSASWVGTMMLIYGVLLTSCRRLSVKDYNDINVNNWRLRFYTSTIIAGVGWAALFIPTMMTIPPLTHQVMQFSVLLCIMILVAITAYPLKLAGSLIAIPAVLLLAVRFAVMLDPVSLIMSAVLIIAQVFFSVLGEKLFKNALNNLKNQAEKDQLIAELATASSISEEARRRAEEANLAKSRFLATMSHELRTPLNAILGFSEVMKNEVLGPLENSHYKEYSTDIHASGTHLLELINEILDLSRIEAGRYNLVEEAILIEHVATECEQLIKLKAKNKGISIVKQIARGLPQVWADERSIRQVILNLLSNALKFTPTGGRIEIRIGWTAAGGQYITIRDNGPGIPEEEIPVVLSSFGQGSIAIKSAEQGTGLGLPIVQALVDKHEGTFELKSKLREGTEVTVTLPSSRVMEVMPAIEQETPSVITPEITGKKRFSIFRNRQSATG